jgi:NADH-quinone oxidoreductase subunit L
VERNLIDRIVNSLGPVITGTGSALRFIQSGNIGSYILFMVLGVVLLLVINILR